MKHHLHVDGSKVLGVDGDAIPTGKFIDVEGTPFDFRTPRTIDYRFNDIIGLCGKGEYLAYL